MLLALGAFVSAQGSAAVTVTVDPQLDRRTINPFVYGVNFADTARMAVVPYPLNRWGGNSTTRYNWKVDVSNHANDWFFLNIADSSSDPTWNAVTNNTADLFLRGTLSHGGQPLLTVPTIGFTPLSTGLTLAQARLKRSPFSIIKYGPQTNNEAAANGGAGDADAGNGQCNMPAPPPHANYCSNGLIVGNDTHDASEAITPTFVTDWMTHISGNLTAAGLGRLRYYALDNEPVLWNSTHRDVHPQPLTYDELWNKTWPIAAAIKTKDPAAKITGPAEWGWCGYMTSAADGCNYFSGADKAAHGNLPLLQWYLDKVCQYQQQNGVRLVDYLDIHYYPQGSCIPGLDSWNCPTSVNEDAAHSAARLRALKELYDPDWHSEDWIGNASDLNEKIDLIPRMKQWIAGHCAGTGLAITEYNLGHDAGASAALAQAEALAIFGREGVDMATRWVAPASGTPTEDAFRLFLGYDYDNNGTNTHVHLAPIAGDTVRARNSSCDPTAPAASRPCNVGSYGMRGIAGQLWVLLVNHATSQDVATVTFAQRVTGPATLYRFDPAVATPRINNNGTATVSADGLGFTAPLTLPPRTAILAVVQIQPALPFSDGFESGGLAAWVH